MTLPRFQVLTPTTLDEALSLLAEHAPKGGRVLAGGTDLLVGLKRPIYQHNLHVIKDKTATPDGKILSTISSKEWKNGKIKRENDFAGPLISLHKLQSLRYIKMMDNGDVNIGALTTAREIQRSAIIREKWTALAEGADALGSPLVRARGTIGGNICNARPAADLVVPAMALGATLLLKSIEGMNAYNLNGFITAPGVTKRKPHELLTVILLPVRRELSGSAYYKLAQRKALDISVVSVAASVKFANKRNKIERAEICMGAVGPTPLISRSASIVLENNVLKEKLLREAAKAAAHDCKPIDDHRGSAEYRRQMVQTLTLRVLHVAFERAREA